MSLNVSVNKLCLSWTLGGSDRDVDDLHVYIKFSAGWVKIKSSLDFFL